MFLCCVDVSVVSDVRKSAHQLSSGLGSKNSRSERESFDETNSCMERVFYRMLDPHFAQSDVFLASAKLFHGKCRQCEEPMKDFGKGISNSDFMSINAQTSLAKRLVCSNF